MWNSYQRRRGEARAFDLSSHETAGFNGQRYSTTQIVGTLTGSGSLRRVLSVLIALSASKWRNFITIRIDPGDPYVSFFALGEPIHSAAGGRAIT